MSHPTETADVEDDLRRRLADIAATTTVDPDAWATITRRAAAGPSRRRPTRRQVAAVAAAVALVIGVLTLSRDGSDRTETVDDTTTTTDRATPSTTDPDRTTTTLADGPSGDRPATPTPPGAGAGPGGGGPGGGAPGATDPGGTETGTDPSSSAEGPRSPGATTPPPAAPTAPDGRPIAASVPHDGHTYDITAYEQGGNLHIDLFRDASYYLTMSSWYLEPGRNCLAGDASIYTDGEPSLVRWGIVRADAAAVHIVSAGGDRSTAALSSPVAPGVRAWIGLRPAGDVDRYEAHDTSGHILHAATSPGWDAPGPC